MGSPFMGRLMALAADRLTADTAVGARVLDWPGDPAISADSVPLRFAGALHALRLDGLTLNSVYPPAEADDDTLWTEVEAALADHAPRLLAWLDRAPQTNEVRRSAALLPVLAALGARWQRPVSLVELGASGGLNLRADRFRLQAGGRTLGGESPVVLTPDWQGPAPDGDLPAITGRTGVDIAPVDPATDSGALTLLAYLWPDQADRVARTRAAIGIARQTPVRTIAADAGTALEELLATRPANTGTLVFHTVAWQYFPPETAARARAALDTAGMAATPDFPLARFGMEADGGRGAGLTLQLWPGGEEHAVGRADFHGRWIDWRGLP